MRACFLCSFGFGRHKGTSAEKTCGTVFDGYGGTLAHAFYPEDGRIHFDESEKFTLNSGSGTNLLWVAVHEIGHVLGLDHTNVKGAIMHPIYSDDIQEVKLHSDDIAGMQYLYGKTVFCHFFNYLSFLFAAQKKLTKIS